MKSPNRLSVTYAVLERGTEKACHQGDDEGRGLGWPLSDGFPLWLE